MTAIGGFKVLKILIVESNAPETVDARRTRNLPVAADHYAVALRANAERLSVVVVEPYRSSVTDDDLIDVDGVVFTGSGVPWSVDTPEAAPLRSTGELVLRSGLPVLGSCNGLQLCAYLLGGSVGASPNGLEIGLARNIKITPEGRAHRMMAGRRDGFCVPCVHRDEVQRLPAAATLISQNDHSPVQAVAYQAHGVDFWGMQYHPEMPVSAIASAVQDSTSIFGAAQSLVRDLHLAETDQDAAARLGGNRHDLGERARTTEIANWLQHIQKPSD